MSELTGNSARASWLRQRFTFLGIAVLLFLFALGSVLYLAKQDRIASSWESAAIGMESSLGRIVDLSQSNTLGDAAEFATIGGHIADFEASLQALQQGAPAHGINKMSGRGLQHLNTVEAEWLKAKPLLTTFVANKRVYLGSGSDAVMLVEQVAPVVQTYEQILRRLYERGGSASQVYAVAEQLGRISRLRDLARGVNMLDGSVAATMEKIQQEAEDFHRGNEALAGMLAQDSQSAASLREVDTGFESTRELARGLVANLESLKAVQQVQPKLEKLLKTVAESTVALRAASDVTGREPKQQLLVYMPSIVGIGLILLFVSFTVREARSGQRQAEERDSLQQAAILNLLDEITNLADGDLTVNVTVTENFTGAIADSINYTVETLRRLVGTINRTSVEIAAAAASTQDTAQKMNRASERQAREIAAVTTIVSQSSQSLTEVAGRAERLASEAANSVQTAHDGASTVGRTIQGMASLREQIQDTAKRIKRLGESSQEIGNIIEFINDIADQTNTLALNASIQAAMAGEAGRGFAVVADEVQRLAERAGAATRQIENLVKTIQADTNEAIISMERSTSNVVGGAKSAEEAGQALTKIESTSTELSRLIQEISGAARTQAGQATRVAGQMQTIREIAVQTSGSAGQTAQAVGELTSLSEKLRESVAGFKLPTDVSLATGLDLADAA